MGRARARVRAGLGRLRFCCRGLHIAAQVENDKSSLFYVLLEVPMKVVKHLQRTAQAGYDKLRIQLESQNGGDPDEREAPEVR